MDAMFASVLGVSDLADFNEAPKAVVAGALPADFVFAVSETAYGTLQDWLEGVNAPAEVKSLLSLLYSLGTPEFADADTVAQAAQAIAALGGAFNGPSTMGISHVKEHAQVWAAARN
jgi:hypothetical protein